jgi:S1-C subfamily serine protease
MNLSFKQLGAATILLLLGGGLGVFGSRYLLTSFKADNPSTPSPAIATSVKSFPFIAPETNPNDLNFIAKAAQKVGPAVVRIDAARQVSDGENNSLAKPFFRRFFGQERPIPEEHREYLERGTGSGFILSADGRVLTNAHVIEGTTQVKVTLKDGKIYQGKVMGVDPMTDIAVIQIQANNWVMF